MVMEVKFQSENEDLSLYVRKIARFENVTGKFLCS